jgi:predicted nucleotidyltransferase
LVWIFTFGSLVLEQEEAVVFVRRRLSTMSQAKKKNFKIEPFKHKVEMDPKYAEKTWKILEDAIHEIYNHNASGLSFEELYRYEKRERERAIGYSFCN